MELTHTQLCDEHIPLDFQQCIHCGTCHKRHDAGLRSKLDAPGTFSSSMEDTSGTLDAASCMSVSAVRRSRATL